MVEEHSMIESWEPAQSARTISATEVLHLAVEHAKLNAGGSHDSTLAAYLKYSVRTVKVETAIADFPLAVGRWPLLVRKSR